MAWVDIKGFQFREQFFAEDGLLRLSWHLYPDFGLVQKHWNHGPSSVHKLFTCLTSSMDTLTTYPEDMENRMRFNSVSAWN